MKENEIKFFLILIVTILLCNTALIYYYVESIVTAQNLSITELKDLVESKVNLTENTSFGSVLKYSIIGLIVVSLCVGYLNR